MKLSLLAAAAVGVFALNASATTVLWDEHDSLELAAVLTDPGSFEDFVRFSIADLPFDITSTTVANNLTSVLGIDNGTVRLFEEATNTLVGQYNFSGETGSSSHTFQSLAPGSYFYEITGNATGTQGGFYSIASTVTLIPEPQSLALLLAGLGVVGSLYRRRTTG